MANIIKNLKQSLRAYRKFFPVIISAILIAAIPPAIVMGLGFLAVSGFSVSQTSALIGETYFSQPLYSWEEKTLPPELESWWFLGFAMVSALMSLYLLAGTYGVCLGAIKGKTSMDAFFESLNTRGVSLAISKILVGLIFAGIFSVLIIIGIIFAVAVGIMAGESAVSALILLFLLVGLITAISIAPFFTLVSPSVVSGRGVVNAIRESISIGKKNYVDTLGVIVIILVMLTIDVALGYLNGVLGVLVSFAFVSPMIALFLSAFYLERSAGKSKADELKPRKKNSAVKKKSK